MWRWRQLRPAEAWRAATVAVAAATVALALETSLGPAPAFALALALMSAEWTPGQISWTVLPSVWPYTTAQICNLFVVQFSCKPIPFAKIHLLPPLHEHPLENCKLREPTHSSPVCPNCPDPLALLLAYFA